MWLNHALLTSQDALQSIVTSHVHWKRPPTTQLLPALGIPQATHILLQREAEPVVAFPLGTAKTDLKVMIQRKPRIVALIPRSFQRAANTVAILLQEKTLVNNLYREYHHLMRQGLQINFLA